MTEQECIFLVGFSEDIGPVEGGTQVKYTHVVLGDDGFQQVAAWRDGGKVLLSAWDGLLVRFIVILPVGNHHRDMVVDLHNAHFLFQFLRVVQKSSPAQSAMYFPRQASRQSK